MIHHIYANRSNVGDWLSARGIQSQLGAPVQEHFCDADFLTETFKSLSSASPEDLILIGGGGLFMDYFVPFWEGFRELSLRVPFAIWGVGYCAMKREDSLPPSSLILEILSRSRLNVFRDEMTCELLPGATAMPPVPCPSFLMIEPIESRTPSLLHVDHFNNVGPAVFDRMVAIGQEFAKSTRRSYRKTNNLIPAGQGGALAKVIELYSSADIVLTSRLHGCILAVAMGRKVLAVSGDHKVESFMEAAGLGDWVVDLDSVDLVPSLLQEIQTQPSVRAFADEARALNRGVGAKLRALLSSRGLKGVAR